METVCYYWDGEVAPRGNFRIRSYLETSEARRGRVLAIVNQKGGVGKTTTAVNLTASLAAAERVTLLVDIDPQGNASSAYGVIAPPLHLYDALLEECVITEITRPTALSHLHLVPSGPDLVGAEIELVTMEGRELRMRRALEPVTATYDYVVIDCPPSLGLLTLNALTAADAVIIPLQCEYYALEGLARLLDTIERVRRGLNPGLEIEGIVLTMTDRRANLCRQVESEVRGHFGAARRRVTASRSCSTTSTRRGRPATCASPRSCCGAAEIGARRENRLSCPFPGRARMKRKGE
jgi:chromosome partitioning protein